MRRPVRSCIGCRGREDKVDLLRIVWSGDRAAGGCPVVDENQTAPGRGAYLHRTADCVGLAIKRRSLGRALRVPGVDPAALTVAVSPYLDGPSVPTGRRLREIA